MSMDPIKTTEYINEKYKEYISSILSVKDERLKEKAFKKISEGNKFIKGPYLEITPEFEKGRSINNLIEDNILSKDFKYLNHEFKNDRLLYKHQEVAINKVCKEKKNIIVATGTGSGKTECFLIPIINELMKENEEGKLNSGVRALLLYPMNALANDQIKRLRKALKEYQNITFGRYTGETPEKYNIALESFKKQNNGETPTKNELICREQMRANPPHILLTNYAMLEYLLLRPEDNAFFDNNYGDTWRFIVLDEAHTYKGASGSEISMLLKRLKERVNGYELGKLQCIATSATLGGGKEDFPKVADFASELFSEKFYPEDIIESKRKKFGEVSSLLQDRKCDFYTELKDDYNNCLYNTLKFEDLCSKYNIKYAPNKEVFLYELLKNDKNLRIIQNRLTEGTKNISEVIEWVFTSDNTVALKNKEEALVSLIELACIAKVDESSKALLPARYHLFVKSLEGMYASFYPTPEIYLERREEVNINNSKIKVFELANCQKCGQEYIVGTRDGGYLKHYNGNILDEHTPIEYFKVCADEETDEELDDDDCLFVETKNNKLEDYILCTVCGKIEKVGKKRNKNCCNVYDDRKYLKVKYVVNKGVSINSCTSCGGVLKDIIKRFLTADTAATNVISRSLYEMIPGNVKITMPKEDVEVEEDDWFFDDGEESAATQETVQEIINPRKLLIFSDNRQEAAFFASYMNDKYNQILWRKIIIKALMESKEEYLGADEVITRMVRIASENDVYEENIDKSEKNKIASTFLIKEIISIERNTGLEALGLINFRYDIPKLNRGYDKLNLSVDEFYALINILLDSYRYQSAVSFPSNIIQTDEAFEPRNREVFFRLEESELAKDKTVLGQLPKDKSENKRSNFIKRILIKNGLSKEMAKVEAKTILKELSTKLDKIFIKKGIVEQIDVKPFGTVKRLNYKKINISLGREENKLFICNKCGKVTSNNIMNLCPEFRCEGTLVSYSSNLLNKYKYYKELYNDLDLKPMIAKEHTAQLTSNTASSIQSKFEEGKINVLSCSTTFEMGVDVGQLEAIVMRNVPPETSNYIQRAGRAGRRGSSTAFVVTFARRRSHDINYYNNPEKIISGIIKAPYLETKNDRIIKRHMNSIIFAYFFKIKPELFRRTSLLFNEDVEGFGRTALKEILDKHPEELMDALTKVVPKELHEKLKIINWGFIDELCGDEGYFTRVENEYRNNINQLKTLQDERFKKGDNTDYINKIMNTYRTKSNINYLSDRNILPKYGFPVDVVSLDILNNDISAKEIEISRDLKMAISELAPGSSVVANGKVWTSYSINQESDKGWPTFDYAICDKCKKIHTHVSDISSKKADSKIEQFCQCGEELKIRKFIKPEFGFSTNVDTPKVTGDNKPKKYYASRVTFEDFEKLDIYQEKEVMQDTIYIGGHEIIYKYAPMGKLLLVNSGFNNMGFRVCKYCGYATTDIANKENRFKHKNKFGNICPSEFAYNVDLGHQFNTDVLKIDLPILSDSNDTLWYSLLYAIIEGACDEFDIVRNDINGCLYYNNLTVSKPSLIIFDEAAGGAGHVKKISTNLKSVLEKAHKRVSNCDCGEETSCYGCLRNYNNQIFHEKLQRGVVKDYLEKLIK